MPLNINGKFSGKDILSIDQFDRKSLEALFLYTKKLKRTYKSDKFLKTLSGKIITLLFYEPSSRTFGSFAAAVKRTGGQTVDVQNPQQVSSVAKGETLEDTIRTFASYSDAIVMRHPEPGSVKKAADVTSLPMINAGDGIGEHPTQALLDGFTLYEKFGKLDGIKGLIAGDLLNGRTAHSLIKLLSIYKKVTLYLLSPKSLRITGKENFEKRGITLIEIHSEKDIPKDMNFWYWTRIQKERFTDMKQYENVKDTFIVTKEFFKKYAGVKTLLMHPLPRVGEISPELDLDPRTMYFIQMKNGMYLRMALLSLILADERTQ